MITLFKLPLQILTEICRFAAFVEGRWDDDRLLWACAKPAVLHTDLHNCACFSLFKTFVLNLLLLFFWCDNVSDQVGEWLILHRIGWISVNVQTLLSALISK